MAPPGQGANSQLGPLRPTLLPSGHSFASIWHAAMGGSCVGAMGAVGSEQAPSTPSSRMSLIDEAWFRSARMASGTLPR